MKIDQQVIATSTILDAIEDGVFIFNPVSLGFSFVNQGAIRQTGYARAVLLGMTTLDLGLEYDERRFRQLIDPLLRGQVRTLRLVTSHRHQDGRDIPVEMILQQLELDNGEHGVLAIARDITERKEAEKSLKRQKEFLNAIFESEPECVKVMLPSGQLLQLNHAGLEMLEVDSLEEAQQAGLVNFVYLEDQPAFQHLTQRVLSGESGRLEFRIVGKRGTSRWLETHASPLYETDGKIYALVGVTRDITEKKKAEIAYRRETSEWIQAMDSFEDVIYLLDSRRRLIRANRMFYALTQTTPAEAIGKHIARIIHPHGEQILCPVCSAQEEKRDAVITMEASHPDNPAGRPLEITNKIIRDESGIATGILVAIHDLTKIRENEARLRESEETLKRAQAVAHLGSWKVNLRDGKTSWSDEVYRILDLPLGGPASLDACFNVILEEDRDFVTKAWNAALTGAPYDVEYRVRTGQGVRWVRDRAEITVDERGRPLFGIGTLQDITDSKESKAQIEFLAFHDALTGLPNRLLAKEHFEMAIAQTSRKDGKVALLFLDLDNFKTINDSLGHAVGDGLLQAAAERLRKSVRNSDTISRQGGDEFLVLLSGIADTEAMMGFAEKILGELGTPFDIQGYHLSTSASIGIAVYPDDGRDFHTLLKKADTAMYQSKKSGRGTFHFYTEQMNVEVVEYHQMRTGLAQALAHNEFTLHYQPQIDIASGAIIGAEALLRWQHPERGMVPPAQFIPIAEDSGHVVAIGEWVLQEACRQAVAWQQAGLPELVIAVNLSAVQFKRSRLEDTVTRALTESGLRPQLLELELTESILIQDADNILGTLHRLKALGIKLSIDDFGTGYSSLSYLSRFAVEKLKIDQSFVHDMVNNPGNAAIVRAIIQMAKSLGLKTVAEGVEDEQQLAQLRLHHCDEAQGYHFGKPMTAEQFTRLF
ncbi:MAG TPA: EAL domain-containing protein [Gallionellaceae bacterium]